MSVTRLSLYTNDGSDSSSSSGDDESSDSNSVSEHDLLQHSSVYSRWYFRYIILFFVCIIKFVQNYIYEIPSGIENVIIQTVGVDVTRYSLLYSVYSWPNTVLPLVGGILIDRVIGLRLGTLFFMFISLIGQLGFSLGGYFDSFILMVVSRFVIGVGSQMALVITDAFAARWFKGKSIALMFTLIGISCRLGGVVSIYSNIVIYDFFAFTGDKHTQLGWTLMVSFFVLLIATILTFILVTLDKRGDKYLKKDTTRKDTSFKKSPRKSFRIQCHEWFKTFNLQFWMFCMMFLTFYASIFPFVTTSQLFFVSKFGLSPEQANTAVIISYGIPLISPIIGILMDRTGGYVCWALLGGLNLLFGAHLLFGLSSSQFFIPFIGNTIIGLSYICFNTAIRVVPAILINEKHLVTAYGLLEIFGSIGYSANNVIVGALIDNYGYFAQEIYLLCFILVGVFSAIFVLPSKANRFKLLKK